MKQLLILLVSSVLLLAGCKELPESTNTDAAMATDTAAVAEKFHKRIPPNSRA